MMTLLSETVEGTRPPLLPVVSRPIVATVTSALPAALQQGFRLPSLLGGLADRARRFVDRDAADVLSADVAESFYACTGCLRCRSWCEHGNDVPSALQQGRAAAASEGMAPAAASVVKDRFARAGHAEPGDVQGALEALSREAATPVSPAAPRFLPGCEAVSGSPSSVRAGLAVAARLGEPMTLAAGVVCCGRPLFEAGWTEAFAAHVSRVWELLGTRSVVVGSAACARALTEHATSAGVTPRAPVTHLTTHLARRLASVRREGTLRREPLEGSVVFHDPCQLGRGLGEYDAPRELLDATGLSRVEARENREKSDCCGAGGLLPRTFPDTARALALARADALRDTGATRVATACPACRRALVQAGLDAVDVTELLDEWLSGTRPA